MIAARAFLKSLYDHWSLVETLALKSRELPFLDGETVARVSLAQSGQDRPAADEAVRQLVSRGILLVVEGREEYQLHGPTRDFALSLAQEHELGLAETIRAEVAEMQRLGDEIQAALAQEDLASLIHPLGKLGNRMQRISLQLDHDHKAILNIADRAKALPTGTPLAIRYREVVESFDRYIEPMTQLLQRDESGFAALTERIEDQILEAERLSERRGALVTQRRRLSSTAYALRSLRSQARERLAQCTETLLPLREEYLRNSSLAISVANLLAVTRKRGLRAAIPGDRLKLGRATRSSGVVPGRFAKAYMADVMRFQPESVLFPESPDGPPSHQNRLRLEEVLEAVRAELPIGSLLPWLQERYPQQGEKDLLRLYHELVRHFGDQAHLQDQEQRERLPEHILVYHPHSLEARP